MTRAGLAAILMALCALMTGSAAAQEEPAPVPAGVTLLPGSAPTGVYVTTQDFSSLRAGPGRNFTRLTVVPPAVTLPAYGRSPDTGWVQVEYDGQHGWISALLLVWTGDVIELPVDGIDPEPFIRRAAALGITTRDTPIYVYRVAPENQVGMLPAGTQVEITGRLGGEGDYEHDYFRMQIRWQGELYWVSSYNIRPIDGDYFRLLDIAYLYPYGQLYEQLRGNQALALGSYRQISEIWFRLGAGLQVACSPIPPQVPRDLSVEDAAREPLFIPAVSAIDDAIAAINSAIIAFENACAAQVPLTQELIDAQFADLAEADRALTLVSSFLEPLRVRNPLFAGGAP